jgi:hypothetical protein
MFTTVNSRLGGEDHQAHHVLALHLGVDADVIALLAGDVDDPLPAGPQLGAHPVRHLAVVVARLLELVVADVDPLQPADDISGGALFRAAVEELGRQPQHRPVQGHVDGLAGLGRQLGEVDVDAGLRVRRPGGDQQRRGGQQRHEARVMGVHDDSSFHRSSS